ncbi:MAG: leucine-rich repeat domain-containing protein, partial [Ureaplasma sp.]|nr:leucine-rich repeat domain-containing protein [Ureaplasma sp.]
TSKYTQNDLFTYMENSFNATTIKELVAQNLYVSDTIKLDSSQIGIISSNVSGIITINLIAPTNVKYSAEENTNVIVSNNKITISNLQYYSEVKISNLSNVHNYFQSIISNNSYSIDSFSTYISNNQATIKSSFIDNSSISIIGGDGSLFSASDILSVTFNLSSQLVFTLKDVSHRKYSIQSANDVVASGNVITFSNFNFTINPETYFTWNGNQITGLSSAGKALSKISVPSRATSITNYAFTDNKNLVSIDMSLSNITIFPDGDSVYGLFKGCTALNNIIFPKNLTKIGSYTFYGCSSLTTIKTPDSVTTIGDYSFYNCAKLYDVTFGLDTIKFGVNIVSNINYGHFTITLTFPTYKTITLVAGWGDGTFIPPNSANAKYRVRTQANKAAIYNSWGSSGINYQSSITIY